MRIYLDTSALNRIFDNQSKPRIYLEATAMLIVFMFIESQNIEMVSSDVLLFENDKIIKNYKGSIVVKNPIDFVAGILQKEENQ